MRLIFGSEISGLMKEGGRVTEEWRFPGTTGYSDNLVWPKWFREQARFMGKGKLICITFMICRSGEGEGCRGSRMEVLLI